MGLTHVVTNIDWIATILPMVVLQHFAEVIQAIRQSYSCYHD